MMSRLGLLALTIKFFQEILHLLPNILDIAEGDLILLLLSLVDITLVGGLMVMPSGMAFSLSRTRPARCCNYPA